VTIGSAGVVGLGTMGAGIVEVFARAGLDVVAVELDDALVAAGRGRLEASLQRAVDRGRLDAAECHAVLGRVTFSADRSALAGCDLVTEAVPERLDIKTELFADLDRICGPGTILATNTSSLPVTRIAAATGRPELVVGVHFFNPAPVMRLVEVVHTVLTDTAVVAAVRELAERCGKTPVVVGDRAGFVANALLFGYLNAAALAAETNQAAITDIDAAMVAACGLPMGPLTLLDLIGLDVSLDVLETMYDETRDQRYAPAPLLKRLVMAGRLGRKSGAGYYRYEGRTSTAAVGVEPVARPEQAGAARSLVVIGTPHARLLAALGSPRVISYDDEAVRSADVVVVDGGSRTATADLAARIARRAGAGAAIAVATDDEAPVATMAGGTGRVQDVVGLHVPQAPRGAVLEVVRTMHSSEAAVAAVVAAVQSAGVAVVPCRDRPGHLVDMLVLPHLGDAVRMVDDGYASRDDVDTAMRLGCGYTAGPFELLEALGADDVRSGLLHLAAATHRSALAPAPLLDELAGFG
jgi:3-hydroxybutyryl-CoA dehydrogenase